MSEIELTALNNFLLTSAGVIVLIATYTFVYYSIKNIKNGKDKK